MPAPTLPVLPVLAEGGAGLEALLAHPGVVEEMELGGEVGVMALHGGLEAGTSEIARWAAAASGASLYAVHQPNDLAWHVPSPCYDPRVSYRLSRFLGRVRLAVSLHGYRRRRMLGVVLVGGANRRFASCLAEALRARLDLEIIDDLERIPPELRGLHPSNPVNLPVHGGVQIELPPEARRGRAAEAVAAAVAGLAGVEMASALVS